MALMFFVKVEIIEYRSFANFFFPRTSPPSFAEVEDDNFDIFSG